MGIVIRQVGDIDQIIQRNALTKYMNTATGQQGDQEIFLHFFDIQIYFSVRDLIARMIGFLSMFQHIAFIK